MRALLVSILLVPPIAMAEAELRDVAQISVGHGHVCAVTTNHAVVCWGDNAAGQLGVGKDGRSRGPNTTRPHVVGGLPAIARVSAGSMHTCATSVDGEVWCWGSAGGDLKETPGGSSGSIELKGDALGTPVQMPLGDGKARFVALGSKGNDACAVYADEVRCWSTFRAIPINARKVAAPVLRTTKIANVTALASGHGKVCVVADKKLSCWSKGAPSPAVWTAGDPIVPVDIAMGEMYACVASANGEARCWWSLIDEFWKRPPDKVVRWANKPPTRAIVVGDSPVCTVDSKGVVDCFLSDEGGLPDQAVGASWATKAIAPHPIAGIDRAIAIGIGRGRDAFGYGFGCALRADSQVMCWGDNEHGQLGNGDTKRSKRAVRVLRPIGN